MYMLMDIDINMDIEMDMNTDIDTDMEVWQLLVRYIYEGNILIFFS
jgi:hypothetical protein